MPDTTDPIADVDPELAEALRAWLAWFGRDRRGSAEEPEKRLAEALRALARDPLSGLRRRILAALMHARNDREAAAAALGWSARTLARRMGDLDLWDAADKQAEVYGFTRRTPGTARKAGKPRRP